MSSGTKLTGDTAEADSVREQGNTLFRAGNLKDALAHYEKAFELNNQDSSAASNAAKCILDLGEDATRAEYYADRAIDIKPEWEKAYYRKGCALVAQSKYVLALASFQMALKINPNNKDVQVVYKATADLAEGIAKEAGVDKGPAEGGLDLTIISMLKKFNETLEKSAIKDVNKWQRANDKKIHYATPLFKTFDSSAVPKSESNLFTALNWDSNAVNKVVTSTKWVNYIETFLKAINFNGGKDVPHKLLEVLVREPWRASSVLNADLIGESASNISNLLRRIQEDNGVKGNTSILNFIIPEHPLHSAILIYKLISEMENVLENDNRSKDWKIVWSFQVDEKIMRNAGASEMLTGLVSTNHAYVTLVDAESKTVLDFLSIWDALVGSNLTAKTKRAQPTQGQPPKDVVVLEVDGKKFTPKYTFERFFADVAGGGPNGDLLFYLSDNTEDITKFLTRIYSSGSLMEKQASEPSKLSAPKALNPSSTKSTTAKPTPKKEIVKPKTEEIIPEIELKSLDQYMNDDPLFMSPRAKSTPGRERGRKKSVSFDKNPPEEISYNETDSIDEKVYDTKPRSHYSPERPVKAVNFRKEAMKDAMIVGAAVVLVVAYIVYLK